ncbi:MAG: hypothetical protein HYR98_05875, partial [Nitrospirae bacterium]|nr:hypothetical protein [Nitrospirota bacterium]
MFRLSEFRLNRHAGQWAFGLQRLTGLLLVLYLAPHVLLNGTALLYGPEAYNELAGRLSTPFGHGVELLVIAAVLAHLGNGVRIVLMDFFALSRQQKRITTVFGAATLAALAAAAV